MPPRLPPEQVPQPDPDPVGDGIAPAIEPDLEREPVGDGIASEPEPRPARRRRRVTTEAPPGTDPTPSSEPPRHALNENDQRLREDKPPHY